MGKLTEIAFLEKKIAELEAENKALKNNQKTSAGLQENARFLNSIIDNLPIGFQLYNQQGYSIRMNERQRQLLGIENADYDVSAFNILEDAFMQASGISPLFQRANQGETVTNFENEVDFGIAENYWDTHKFKKYYNLTIFPVFDIHYQVAAVACLTEDITERKLATRALQESKNSLEEAQDFGKLGSWSMDLKTRKLEWSRQVFASFGLDASTETPSYEEYQKMIHPNDWKKLSNEIQSTLTDGTHYEIQIRHRQPDGSYTWICVKGKPDYNEAGQIVGISGVNQDINSQKQAEAKIKKSLDKLKTLNAELKKINSELDRFVYSCSHDLRAPIASVLGLIGLCKLTTNPDELQDYFQKQEICIQKLDHFIREILDYSRNARMEVEQVPVNFQVFLEGIFEQHNYLENSENIQKTIEVEQSSPFYTDLSRMSVIFNNLISNAIRYSDKWKSQSEIEVIVIATQQEAHIIIRDNGQGIGEARLHKVFDMYYRGNESQTGSGLGLYIVKEALDKLGGSIDLSSQLGEGTTITLHIPNNLPANFDY